MDLADRVIRWAEEHREELNASPLALGWDGVIELHWNPKVDRIDGLVRVPPLPLSRGKRAS